MSVQFQRIIHRQGVLSGAMSQKLFRFPSMGLAGGSLRGSRSSVISQKFQENNFNFSNILYVGSLNTFVGKIYCPDLNQHETFCKRQFSTKATTKGNMGTILQHAKYENMKLVLSTMKRKGSFLGPLDLASLHILSSKELKVNLDILKLDALSLSSTNLGYKGSTEIREMKLSGKVKAGKFNKDDEAVIEKRFETLLAETRLDKDALMKELYAANKVGERAVDEEFKLKRQLAGFWLLQGMKDGDRRLPMEVYNKLAVLLYRGDFTKEDDATILDWVEKNGATRWAELARKLGRMYLRAGSTVKTRYEEIKGNAEGNRKGAFDSEEFSLLIGEVLKQDPEAFEKPFEENRLDFKNMSQHMGRSRIRVRTVYASNVHPTVRRHKLGNLEKDVRGELIEQVKKNGWKLGADIEFDKLARLPMFEGHNSHSLQSLYSGLLVSTMNRLRGKSTREVTLDQVEVWWNSTTRYTKSVDLIEKEGQIVEAYYKIKQTTDQ